MNDRIESTRGRSHSKGLSRAFASAIAIATAASACSGSNDDATITPSSLATTCGQVCNNVLAQCSIAASAYTTCTNACTTLLLAPETCITQFAGYLACLSGATSIMCVSDGQTTTFAITPGSCTLQEAEYENCNNTPGVAACIALPPSSNACSMNAGEGLSTTGMSEFCVGTPDNDCTPTSSANPLGIGTYCCN